MGCDIHLHTEVKIAGEWHHYSIPSVKRDYQLFTKMAGVRDYWENEIIPITQPRGLPENVTFLTRYDSDRWGDDGHSHSWLGAEEIKELASWLQAQDDESLRYKSEADRFGYLFGNNWSDFTFYKEDRIPVEDIRFVFWFDN